MNPETVSVSPRERRILACDDEHQILRALTVILRAEGYEVVPVSNVEQALDAVALTAVDAAIVDLLLPDGDGVELCGRLRERSDMPIIVLSAVSDEDERIRALSAGADHYITKPFRPPELLARLAEVLRRAPPTHIRNHGELR